MYARYNPPIGQPSVTIGRRPFSEAKFQTIEFTNDVYKENEYDRNLYVQAVSVKKVK